MEDRRQNVERRNGDAWLGRAVKITALVGACATPLVAFNARIVRLESTQPAMLYMTCWLMSDAHPRQVPAVCSEAIRSAQ